MGIAFLTLPRDNEVYHEARVGGGTLACGNWAETNESCRSDRRQWR